MEESGGVCSTHKVFRHASLQSLGDGTISFTSNVRAFQPYSLELGHDGPIWRPEIHTTHTTGDALSSSHFQTKVSAF